MDAKRFDDVVRALGARGPRRSLLMATAGAVTGLVRLSEQEAAAGCRKAGARCRKGVKCCSGSRCRRRRCRCKDGLIESPEDGRCRPPVDDPGNGPICNPPCDSGCCLGGACYPLCNGACCTDCFAEATYITEPPLPGTEACCDAASVCNSGTNDPADDLCCWPDEACIDGKCCCNGCEGTVVCGGVCCPSVSCCNGLCCPVDQVCATTAGGLACVAAERSCGSKADCFAGEDCTGGVCCSGDRICTDAQTGDPVCCDFGRYCDPNYGTCCANGVTCGTTAKKVRIRV